MILWRVCLGHETGFTILADGFASKENAAARAEEEAVNYGDGQDVYIERYVK